MKVNILLVIIVLFMSFCIVIISGRLYAESMENGSPNNNVTFNRDIYESIKSDKNFYYEEDPVLKKSILTDIQLWFAEKLGRIMRITSSRWFDGFMLVLFTLLFLGAVYLLFRLNPGGVFYSESKKSNAQLITDAGEHHKSYKIKLDEAIESGHWRHAVRFTYLITLQSLETQGIIKYRPEKSPGDYQNELASHRHAGVFHKLIYVYTYVWYGNFNIDAEAFFTLQKLIQTTHVNETRP